jgi:hypothetical protein
MILRELFYLDPESQKLTNDFRFDAARDLDELQKSDTRKTKLTLKQINELRKSSEAHILEQEQELEFVHTMYGTAAAAPPA